jgi:hypothetical protein
MMADFNIWLGRLSNWQFVAVVIGLGVLIFAFADGVDVLISGQFDLRSSITTGVLDVAILAGLSAWKRWK